MADPRVWKSTKFEAGTKFPAARVVDKNGTVCMTGDFSGSVVVRVYDLQSNDPSTPILSNTLTVAATITNTLQSWDVDDEGYNYITSITSNQVAWEGGHVYRISSLLPHTVDGYIPVVHEITIRDLMSL